MSSGLLIENCSDCGSADLRFKYNKWICTKCEREKEEFERSRNKDEEKTLKDSDDEAPKYEKMISDHVVSRDTDFDLNIEIERVDAKCERCCKVSSVFLSYDSSYGSTNRPGYQIRGWQKRRVMCLECLCHWQPIADWYADRDEKREKKRLKKN
jgi:uncharacterized Zn finger protein (UPF0148 family)